MDQLIYQYTLIVINMELEPKRLIHFYCTRERIENFIKESKSEFDFNSMGKHSKIVNTNILRILILVNNLLNWFKQHVLLAKKS